MAGPRSQTLRLRCETRAGSHRVIGSVEYRGTVAHGRREGTSLRCHFAMSALKALAPYPGRIRKSFVTIGDHLRKRRLDLGLLQREVTERLGVGEATVTNWELNRTIPALRFLRTSSPCSASTRDPIARACLESWWPSGLRGGSHAKWPPTSWALTRRHSGGGRAGARGRRELTGREFRHS